MILNSTGIGVAAPGPSDREVFVEDNFAYVTNFDYGLQIFNITDKSNPFLTSNFIQKESVEEFFFTQIMLIFLTLLEVFKLLM